MDERGAPAYVAEFLGTLLLVFFIGLIYAVSAGIGFLDFAVIGLVYGLVLMVLVASIGPVSGAHVNPAVTLALAALRRIGPADAVTYVVCQLAGAVAGALLVRLLLVDEGAVVDYGTPDVSGLLSDNTLAGALAELMGTFVLMWAVMAVALDPRRLRPAAPFVIGGALGLAALAIAPMTGAGFNPARSFGPAIVSGEFGGAGQFIVVFILAPVAGALLAAFASAFLARGAATRPPAELMD